MPVRNGGHNRADGKAVEIVVNKDKHSEPRRCIKRAALGFYRPRRPIAVCL